jgi:hypothetical protein
VRSAKVKLTLMFEKLHVAQHSPHSPTGNSTGTQSLILNPWDQTRSGKRNFSDFGMVVRGIRGQELSESIAQLISTNW